MNPDDLDKMFTEAAAWTSQDEACRDSIARVERAILINLHPVKVLAPPWVFTSSLLAIFAMLGTVSALLLGSHGFLALSGSQRGVIFPTLLAVAWIASVACCREMRPTSLRFGPLALLVAAVVFPALFSLIFHNYSILNFIPEGVPCLVAGMCVSIVTAPVIFYLLRRGFVMQWARAGLAAGTLSGLTGLAMLELHCPNLKAIHVMTWHVAVVIVSGILGFAAGWVVDHFRGI
jgi:hypothetical protein